jgi:hypothetical protein
MLAGQGEALGGELDVGTRAERATAIWEFGKARLGLRPKVRPWLRLHDERVCAGLWRITVMTRRSDARATGQDTARDGD